MTGVSYNGTLPNQVATTGVEGLRTIIPVSAISSWYDYYRANGLVVAPHSNRRASARTSTWARTPTCSPTSSPPACAPRARGQRRKLVARQDRVTGDYSSFWAKRDYLSRARKVKASVFVVHGLNDWNVKTKAFAAWWGASRVPRKLWLHNGGHGGPRGTTNYKVTENRWFDHWLFGVPNGIMAEPRVTLQREDGAYTSENAVAGRRRSHGAAVAERLRRALRDARPARAAPQQTFVDRGRELDTDDVLIQNPDADHPNRLGVPDAGRSRATPASAARRG